MLITINNGSKGSAKVQVPAEVSKKVNEDYPELAMMLAMEELAEMSQAISKCIRNGSDEKKDNLAEEIVDVLSIIQWAIVRFDIPMEKIQKWADEKGDRTFERNKTDEVILRTNEAKETYRKNHSTEIENGIQIRKMKNDQYEISGDLDNSAEYYHALKTMINSRYAAEKDMEKADNLIEADLQDIFDAFLEKTVAMDKPKKKSPSKKQAKKNDKDLDKVLAKVSKKIKKSDDKKGKKGKK